MDKQFYPNNWFFRFMDKFVDCVLLNLFWIFSSLPIITIGASTTALYYTVVKALRNDHGSIRKEYWRAFRSNFKQATAIWLFFVLLLLFLGADCLILYLLLDTAQILKWLFGILLVMFSIALVWMQYSFSYAAKFSDHIKVILKNSLYLLLSHLENSLWIFTILAGSFALLLAPPGPLLLLVFPTAPVLAISYITEKLYIALAPQGND